MDTFEIFNVRQAVSYIESHCRKKSDVFFNHYSKSLFWKLG